MRPKSNRITITDIAKMANTSKTTVSFFLNGHKERMSQETQDRIQAAIEETGYTPSPIARGMNRKSSGIAAVIISDISNTFSNQIIKGIETVAHKNNYKIIVSSTGGGLDEEQALIKKLLALGVDGFIVQPTSPFMELSRLIEDAGSELVFFDSKFYDFTSNWVKTDNYEATHSAVTRCIKAGYEKFLMVGAEPQLLSSRVERMRGFEDALLGQKVASESLYFKNDVIDNAAISEFLAQNIDGTTPTCVFAPNCWALPDIYVDMRPYYDLMPDTVGLLGFDNTEWVQVASPSVSVVVQPAYKEGEKAMEMLLALIKKWPHDISTHEVLDCEIIWGATTRKLD